MERETLPELVLNSLDEPEDLARRTYRSRTQFFRLFQALIAESPGAMRRRFLLERSAWQLGRTRTAVTEIALEAGFGSLEAFSRAFRRAYEVSPSIYRRTGAWRIHLPAPNEFHYCGPQVRTKGASTDMDLFDLFAGTDSWYIRKLLEQASQLTDEQLDRPLRHTSKPVFGWEKPDQNLREILERMVQTKEVWAAALTKGPIPSLELTPAERSPGCLLKRAETVDADFQRVMREVRDRGAWDETFVDALCEPPETFSFGGTFAHVMTFNVHRRMMALDALQQLGVQMTGIGCPMEYEASLKT
jgi:AraC-like DNA-binding protein